MSSYSNGHNPQGQPNEKPHSHPLQYPGYPPQAGYQQQQLRHTQRFPPGNSVTAGDQQYSSNHASTSMTGGANPEYASADPQLSNQYAQGNNESTLPMRTSSRPAPLSGYQHQYQPLQQAVASPTTQSYNPSHFPQSPTQPQYSPQIFQNSPPTSYTTTAAYQAYNPAAYQPSLAQPASSQYYSQATGYEGHNLPYGSGQTSPPPPPPPRHQDSTGESSYDQYRDNQYAQQSHAAYTSNSSAILTQSSPYSPPPPHPPAHDPYGPDYTQVGQPRPYSHNPSRSSEHYDVSASQSPQPQHLERQSSLAGRVSYNSNAQIPSPQPSLPSPNQGPPPPVAPHRSGTVGHQTHGRPLPGPPSQSTSGSDYFSQNGATSAYQRQQEQDQSGWQDLVGEIDAAIHHGGRAGSRSTRRSPHQFSPHETISETQEQEGTTSPSPQIAVTPDERPTHINGGLASAGEQYINYGAFSDESDAEAAAGVAAMQAAEEQEAAEESRRQSGASALFQTHGSQRLAQTQQQDQDVSSDSDYANVDMGLYAGSVSYGGEQQSDYAAAAALYPTSQPPLHPRMDSLRASGPPNGNRGSPVSPYDPMPGHDSIHPFPPFQQVDLPRVDTGGTGGLTEPSPHPRRLSFEDGDEVTLVDSETGHTSGSVSPSRDGLPELFFSPGFSQRPLPPAPSSSDPGRIPHLIPAGTYTPNQGLRYDANGRPYPSAPNSYMQQGYLSPSQVPRSSSLATRSTPRPEQPIRSKTDADRARILRERQLAGRTVPEGYELVEPGGSVIDLPPIPRKKFNPAKLTREQLKKCGEPWALSSIVGWIRDQAEEETDLKEQALTQGIVALFLFAVPTMNTTDAESLGDRVLAEMFSAGALVKEEEWVKFGLGTVSGVLFQLTRKGCYSSKLHEPEIRGKCYSYHCMRTLRKVDLSLPAEAQEISEDWATFHHIRKEHTLGRDKKEIERQNVLHEIVATEVKYISNLDIVRLLYRDSLLCAQPPVIPPKRVQDFCRDVFGHIDRVKKVNEEFLLAQLKYRQREQGPWIVGFSDIFREWIRKAKSIYVEYASGFPHANFLVRKEMTRNVVFKQFLDQARDNKLSQRLSWDTYIKAPITRLQRYDLLLKTVLKSQIKDSDEKLQLQYAIDEIKAATFECDSKVAEMDKKIELLELKDKLKLRRGMEKDVVLNLDHLGRELIMRGDLLRTGGKGFQWVDTHAILFDHYLVLAKTVVGRDSAGGAKYESYDVSKVPIPMDLLVLESANDEPMKKGSGMSTIAVSARGPQDPRLARTTSTVSGGSGQATIITSGSSSKDSSSINKSMVPTTILEGNPNERMILYPFKLKHLGKAEIYTLYATSSSLRTDWCEAIMSAKHNHALALHAQNAEPFRLRVLADASFGYESLAPALHRPAIVEGTPLDRAIREVENRYPGQTRPSHVCKAAVNCATTFNYPPGRLMCAIGTDNGVFFSEYENPRGWTHKAISATNTAQVAVFEEFNLLLLLSNKILNAFHLDAVCPSGTAIAPRDAAARKDPQRLSGTRAVDFFATGRMKDRALVFYKKRETQNSIFKVLEPVLQKSTTTKSRFLPKRGHTDFFREFDEFYIPTECYGVNLFHSSLAISTARGVEVLTLDKKQPWTVPNLQSDQAETQAHLSSIAARIKDLRPLGMFRLSDAEFLVAFEDCAVYVNKHGDVSRGVIMDFVGKATTACLYGQHLILFNSDFVEIRNATNGRMKQVIAGKDIKMLDDGGGSNTVRPTNGGLGGGMNGLGLQGYGAAPRTVKISMQHPGYDRSVVVVELIENEGRRE